MIVLQRTPKIEGRNRVAREQGHSIVGPEVNEARAGVGKEAIVFHPLADANAKQSCSLPNDSRLRGGAIGGEKIVLPEDKLRIKGDVFCEVVVKPEAQASAPLTDSVQIVDVGLHAKLISRNFRAIISLGKKLRRNPAQENQEEHSSAHKSPDANNAQRAKRVP